VSDWFVIMHTYLC